MLAFQVVTSTSQIGGANALQPSAVLSPELKQELFAEFTSSTPVNAQQPTSSVALPSGEIFFFAICAAAILAFLAVYVLKSVRYDAIVQNPFTK